MKDVDAEKSNKRTRPRQPGFAERLSLVLKDSRTSVSAIAREIGSSEAALRQWANGEAEPPVFFLARLCGATRTRIEWLVIGEGSREAEGRGESRTAYQPSLQGSVNYELLHAVMEQAEESLKNAKLELPTAKRAELTVTLYELFKDRGGHVDRPTVMRLIKLAT